MLVKYVGIIDSIVKQLEEETQPKTPRFPIEAIHFPKLVSSIYSTHEHYCRQVKVEVQIDSLGLLQAEV